MTTQTSRRAVLAGIAALPAVSLPALASEPDPIFAAIERHRSSYEQMARTGLPYMGDPDSGPDCDPERHRKLEKAFYAADDEWEEAGIALMDCKPTSIAGVLALLNYVEEFNSGAVGMDGWRSSTESWPWNEPQGIDPKTVAFRLLSNARFALSSVAA